MRVFVCDRDHPHHGEVGTLTGEIASVSGTPTERQAIAMTPQDSPEARIAEIRDELVRRACEGCEGSLDEICTRATLVKHVWCDPCRCQEGAKAIDALSRRLHEQAQEIERLKDELMEVQSQVTLYWKKASESFEHFQRAEAAEARLRDLEGRTDDGPQPPQ